MTTLINGIKQDIDPRDGTTAVAEVKTGSTFYAGGKAIKTGSGTQTLSNANENVTAGYYEATTLSAVDADLAAGNIKKDVVIFGITGTVEEGGALAEDTTGEANTGYTCTNTDTCGYIAQDLTDTQELTMATVSPTFDNASMTVAVGTALGLSSDLEKLVLRLYIGGTIVDSLYIPTSCTMMVLKGTRAVDGEQECKLTIYNEDTSTHTFYSYSNDTGGPLPLAIGVGSIK